MTTSDRIACPSRPRAALVMFVVGALLIGAGAAGASTAEERCQSSRYAAAAKYDACQQRALGRFYGADVDNFGVAFGKHQALADKCKRKYTATWARLQAQASGTGSTCDGARFVDNHNGTVTDNLSGLQWEQKQNLDATANLSDPHDADNRYTWSAGAAGNWEADGSAYTGFLTALNGTCFAGQCDWRLPTIAELHMILLEEYPCSTSPCIDPIFGPTPDQATASYYWSASTSAHFAGFAWIGAFSNGDIANSGKFDALSVRAVHAGP